MTRDTEAVPTFSAGTVARRATRSRVRGAFGGRRGTAQLGVLVAAAVVAGGLVIGSGVAAHAAKSGYNQAWIADGTRGQVVQVDPVIGRTNVRLQVAPAGDTLEVQQGDGRLIVIDRKTGKISSIDLGTMLVSGNRTEPSGSAVKVVLDNPRIYVVNLPRGTIQSVDPQSQASVGLPWTAGVPLVDVGVDGSHHIWALDADGQLTTLVWNAHLQTLTSTGRRHLSGTGSGSIIVGHPRGVTVVGAQGTIARVGTGNDSVMTSPGVRGRLAGPPSSPDGIVPVANPGNSSVVIVGGGGAVIEPVGDLGCPTPGGPVVFDGKVYVPCLGSGVVVVLGQDGHQIGGPIHTPGGGDPQLTISDGHLLVSAPGSGTATVIDGSGNSHSFPTLDPTIPVQNPSQPPPSPPAPPPPSSSQHESGPNPGDGGHHGGPHSSPSDTPTDTPSTDPPGHGGGTATATARPDGTVLVSWSGPSAQAYTVTVGGTVVAQVPAGGSSATVTVLNPGTTTTLTVHAFRDAGAQHERWAATTNSVTTAGGQAVTVTDVRYTASAPTGGVSTLSVSWTAPAGVGQVSYTVGATGTATTTTTSTTQATLDVPCAGSCSGTITVTPSTPSGAGTPAQKAFTVSAVAPTSAPAPQPVPTTANPAPSPTTQAPTQPTTTAPPAPAALPNAGESMLTTSTPVAGNDNSGDPATETLTISTPPDWAGWTGGTCALLDNGAPADTSPAVPCSANGEQRTIEYYASGTHSYVLRATSTDGRTSDSAAVSVTVRYILTPGCPQNFANIGNRLPDCQTCYNGGGRICPLPPFTAPIDGLEPTVVRMWWAW